MLYCYCVTFSSSTQFHNQGESSCLVGEGAVAQGTGTARGQELLQLQGSTVGCVHGGLVAHPARPGLVAGAAAKRDQSRKPSFLVVLTSFYQPSLSRFHPLEEYFKLLWLACFRLHSEKWWFLSPKHTDKGAFPDPCSALEWWGGTLKTHV